MNDPFKGKNRHLGGFFVGFVGVVGPKNTLNVALSTLIGHVFKYIAIKRTYE